MAPTIDRKLSPNRLGKSRKHSSCFPILTVVLIVILMVGAVAGLTVHIAKDREWHPSESPLRVPAGILYTTHSPISINGNANFTIANGVSGGTGTASNPYIIADWDINASTATGIWINATDAYFIVRNCYAHDGWNSSGSSAYDGIDLVNCVNGIMENNSCTNDSSGIFLQSSNGIKLLNNTCSSNSGCGIYLYWSGGNNTLTNNTCSNDYYGIALESSNNNTLINNNCSNNQEGIILHASSNDTIGNNNCSNNNNGIDLWLSSSITVSNNSCNLNGGNGVVLTSSSNDILSNNTCNSDWTGIDLESSSNNTLSDNTCCSNYNDGVDIMSSSNNMLSENNCSLNNYEGIYLHSSSDNVLSNNTCSSNNDCGILLALSSSDNAVSKNVCSSNYYDGIEVASSRSNALLDNNCSLNQEYGMYLISSSNNAVSWNQFYNDVGYGIAVNLLSYNNRIWNNTFVDNNGASDVYDPSYVQAFDNAMNNWWNSTEGYGNYWSDWTTPDANHDGIVDYPYVIDGSAGAQDNYPLTTVQTQIPEFGMMPFVVIALMAVIVLTIRARRRKTF